MRHKYGPTDIVVAAALSALAASALFWPGFPDDTVARVLVGAIAVGYLVIASMYFWSWRLGKKIDTMRAKHGRSMEQLAAIIEDQEPYSAMSTEERWSALVDWGQRNGVDVEELLMAAAAASPETSAPAKLSDDDIKQMTRDELGFEQGDEH